MSRPAVLAVGLAAVVTGCGGSKPHAAADPSDTVQGYLDALGRGDYAKACGFLTKEAVRKIESASQRSCAEAVQAGVEAAGGTAEFRGGRFSRPVVSGDRGTTTLTLGHGVRAPEELVREDGTWKLQTPGNAGA